MVHSCHSVQHQKVFNVSSAQDNAKFVSSGGDKTLFYWDVSTGQTIRRIAAHNGKIPAVCLNEDASIVVSGEREDKIELLRCFVLHLAHRIIRHKREDMGPQVAFFAYILGHVAQLKFGRAQNRMPIQSLEDAKDTIQGLLVGPSEIIVGSVDGHVRTYDLRKGRMTSDYLGRTYRFCDFLSTINNILRTRCFHCAYKGPSNPTCDDSGFTNSIVRPEIWSDIEYLSRPYEYPV